MSKPRKRVRTIVKQSGGFVTIYNNSNQMIPIQAKPPGGDFFLEEQVVYLHPGKSAIVSRDFVRTEQLHNLQLKGKVRVVENSG